MAKKRIKKRVKKKQKKMGGAKIPVFVLVGTENDGKRYRYDILKNEMFTPAFVQFMLELGFGDNDLVKLYHDPIKNRPLRVRTIKDDCLYFKNKNYEIDLFYGVSQIVMVVRVKTGRMKRKLLDTLEKYSVWKKFRKKYQRI